MVVQRSLLQEVTTTTRVAPVYDATSAVDELSVATMMLWKTIAGTQKNHKS